MRTLAILLSLASVLTADPDTTKPWTRWWWLGSGVDEANLTRQLEAFAKAGIGGVEICPIYGAKGYENRDLPFLSEQWTAMLDHTSSECSRLGLGIDLTTGTGWPFGGPWVTATTASHSLARVKEDAGAGPLTLKLPQGTALCLRAYPPAGDPVELLHKVENGVLHWTVPEGGCRILGLVTRSPIQKVKRAAPGGRGHVLDPFSPTSLGAYLKHFDAPLDSLSAPQPRAHFHDSFEYYNAAWTPDFLDCFKQRNSYSLLDHLPAFLGDGDDDTVARAAHDYRSTLDHLHRSYLETWNAWAKRHGSLTRNQAHGSPGNLLDHYAVADIPETEIFRHVGDPQIPMLQFAASAAHLTGRKLVSAESFTWLDEHFQVKPSTLRQAADFLWLGGVNHIFFHGIPYTPADAGWPGWLFYASTHMGENGGLWRDLPAFNLYIRKVQQALQSGRPDTAVLLYFPVHELWSQHSDKLPLFTIHNQDDWLHGSSFHSTAMTLWENGIPCDFVSDSMLQGATCEDGAIRLGGLPFRALVVPELQHLPESTAARIGSLVENGASVLRLGTNPLSTPGLPGRPVELPQSVPGSAALLPRLATVGIHPEPITGHGLRFVRRVTEDEQTVWFIVNHSDHPVDQWIDLSTPFQSAVFTDPADAQRRGTAPRHNNRLHFVLAPGETRLLCTSPGNTPTPDPWVDRISAGPPVPVGGTWKVEFLEGGPLLPASYTTPSPASWTAQPDAVAFSGTARYTTTFDARAGSFLLDLGKVAETCRARLNGSPLGTSFFPPHHFDVTGTLKDGPNTLEVEVTNLAANRIAELDRNGVNWKSFHEINFVNIDYKPFDASDWKPLPSGLLGPVQLLPVRSE